MTTSELRQKIHVINFNSHSDGANIHYLVRTSQGPYCNCLRLNNTELFEALQSIGSVDEDFGDEEWADYVISQWDALTLAIRYEYEQSAIKDINKSDLGKAIGNLLTSNKQP